MTKQVLRRVRRAEALCAQLERAGLSIPTRCRLNLSMLRYWRAIALSAALLLAAKSDAVDVTPCGDVDAVAWCIWTEGRGEPWEGKIAIAGVIKTRAYFKEMPFKMVVFRRGWFSGVGDSVPGWFIRCEGITVPDKTARTDCYTIAQAMAEGRLSAPGYTHYYAHKLCRPSWAGKLSNVQVIGNHTFGYYRYF